MVENIIPKKYLCRHLWTILGAIGFLILVQSQYMIDKTKVMEDKILLGYAFRKLTKTAVDECFLSCYEDCFCMAFQVCQNSECQLLSSNRFLSSRALVSLKGCSYYDMLPDLQQIKTRGSCNPASGCRIHINLCPPGRNYIPLTPIDHTTPRYECRLVKSCCAYSNGPRVPGKYEVFDGNMNPFDVFCDFDLKTKTSWTLIQSYQFRYKSIFNHAYYGDKPMNEDTPRWDKYRLSKFRMQSIQNDSSQFRVTCKYDTDGVVYTDYLRATKKQIDILRSLTTSCTRVEYINYRGKNCSKCTANIHQPSLVNNILHLHTKSRCEFQPKRSSWDDEISFGWYGDYNTENRCSSSSMATTQTWLGGN